MKNLVKLLKKTVYRILSVSTDMADIDVLKQEMYLKHLGKPSDKIQRSYFQYLCQIREMPLFTKIAINFASMPLYFYWLIRCTKCERKENCVTNSAVFFDKGNSSILPHAVKSRYSEIINVEKSKCLCCKKDRSFFVTKVWSRYPFSFYFLLKNMIKMTQYRYIIQRYHPQAILVCNEYSFSSSFLTLFCSENNVQHIDIMHGEKLFYIRDAFFSYDECIVWDDYYIELFSRLKAHSSKYTIVPLEVKERPALNIKYDYTYYLQSESRETLLEIAKQLRILKDQGLIVAYRPHPIYENENTAEIMKDFEREDSCSVPILESISQTRNVISKYSTVLYQAYLLDRKVVIDDLSRPDEYRNLKQLGYIMFSKPHTLFSKIINQ